MVYGIAIPPLATKPSVSVAHFEGDTALTALWVPISGYFCVGFYFYHFQHVQEMLDSFYEKSKNWQYVQILEGNLRKHLSGLLKAVSEIVPNQSGSENEAPDMVCIKLAMIAKIASFG